VDPPDKANFTGLHIYKDKRFGQGIQLKGRVQPPISAKIIIHRAASQCGYRILDGMTRRSMKLFFHLE
jgi:hypothetical protein